MPKKNNLYIKNSKDFFDASGEKGNIKLVRQLIDENKDVNITKNGIKPIHAAAYQGYSSIVKLLLANGADINAKKPNGVTPLISASKNGHIETVKVLLAYGANVKIKKPSGYTALHFAAAGNHKEIVDLLIESEAEVNAVTNEGLTPLKLVTQLNLNPQIGIILKAKTSFFDNLKEFIINKTKSFFALFKFATLKEYVHNNDKPTIRGDSEDNEESNLLDIESLTDEESDTGSVNLSGNSEDESCSE